MPNYIPTLISSNNGLVSVVSTDGTSYESITNSMGSFVYKVNSVYMKANTNQQILNGFVIEQYDVSGYIKSYEQKPTIDPYQYQTSSFFKLLAKNVVLNGQTTFDMVVEPNEVLYLNLYITELGIKDYLSENSLLDNDFFRNFTDVI
jgi:hypothetical protein